MKKYAKVVNEETKLCEVGLDTNISYYESIGMTEMEVEQAYTGDWYLSGYAPEKPSPTYEEVKATRASLYASEVDPLMSEYNRKKTFNLFAEGEEAELLAKIEAKVAEIKEANPYPVVEVITPTDETEQVTETVEESKVIEDGLQREETEVVELYSMEI